MLSDSIILLAVVVCAYALGDVSPAILIGKLNGINIKEEGSGNAGTTNVARVLGLKWALATLFFDVMKGFVAVKAGLAIGGKAGCMLAFTAVVVGHCFPVLYNFDGGKGVATTIGSALALDWRSALIVVLILAVIFLISRIMSIGSIIAAIAYPFLMYLFKPEFSVFAAGVGLYLIMMHHENIRRLIRGEEKKLKFGGVKDTAEAVYAAKANEDFTPDRDDSDAKISEPGFDENAEPVNFYSSEIPVPVNGVKNVSVIGNGSFGTAMANVLANNGHNVTLYGRKPEVMEQMARTHINEKYLPYAILCETLKYTSDLKTACEGKDIIVFAVPTQQFRSVSSACSEYISKETVVVNLAKGLELGSLKRLSEVSAETLPGVPYAALSGPSHAEEIVRNEPAGLTVASDNKANAEAVQDAFMSERLRVYTSDDVLGVEIAGAVKNVIAIATGISDGMRLGNNARAILMTRAMHEITRLGVSMGARPETFAGLSGIGDLMVTCSTNLSRNRRCGILIGHGYSAAEAVEKVGTTVEGVFTADAVKDLAERRRIEMPICYATYKVLHGEMPSRKALNDLMSRDRKDEVK